MIEKIQKTVENLIFETDNALAFSEMLIACIENLECNSTVRALANMNQEMLHKIKGMLKQVQIEVHIQAGNEKSIRKV